VRQYGKWMIAMHYARTTQVIYMRALRRYLRFLGDRSITRANHTVIRTFLADASERGATLNTAYRYLGILRQFYDFLNLGGVVDYVAPRFVRLRVPWHEKPGALTQNQIRRLIASTKTRRELAVVEFFYSTGCRLSETLNLKIEDVDFMGRQARVKGKFGKTRLVLLAESASDALRAYIGDRKIGYIFQDDYPLQNGHFSVQGQNWVSKWQLTPKGQHRRVVRTKMLGLASELTYDEAKEKHLALIAQQDLSRPVKGRPLSKMAIQTLVKNIAHRAGVKNVTPHTFRRTFATHLHENGASLEVIRALLGHVWIQTTLQYAKIGPDGLNRSFEKCHPFGNRYEEIET
jgi:site-specific recombinase XerD